MALIGKRGDTTTLSFLIGIIIFLLIIIPIGIAFYHYLYASSKMEQTLDLLIERTIALGDEGEGSIVGYMEEGYVLVGFEKDNSDFGGSGVWSCGGWVFPWNIKKPSKCGNKACLCACPITEAPLIDTDLILRPGACESATCKVYDEGMDPRFYGGSECEYGPFIKTDNPVLEIYYAKNGDTIGICTDKDCISEDINRAREVFDKVYEKYLECKAYEKDDCICGSVEISSMPFDHFIRFKTDGTKTTITLQDIDGPARALRVIPDDYFGTYSAGRDEAVEQAKFDVQREVPVSCESFDFGCFESYTLLKSKGGFVAFAKGTFNGMAFTPPQITGKERCDAMEAAEKSCADVEGECMESCDFDRENPITAKCENEDESCCVSSKCGSEGKCMFLCTEDKKLPEFNSECKEPGTICCKVSKCVDIDGTCKDTCSDTEDDLSIQGSCETGKCCKENICKANGMCTYLCLDANKLPEFDAGCSNGQVCCKSDIEPLIEG
ncbi:MAG: hypothetical protein KJ955_07030 [Nanoarchaeota archaeon]|nr:hypothetical protein [Nanoarchaeota archaeon]